MIYQEGAAHKLKPYPTQNLGIPRRGVLPYDTLELRLSILNTSPSYKIQQFACFPPVVYLGVKNLGDFKLGFTTMTGGGGGWIQLGMVLGEAGSNIEMWKTGCTAHMESGSCKIIE